MTGGVISTGESFCASDTGLIETSLHTSVSKVAVRSRISLCLIMGKPPFAHERACSTDIPFPHSHLYGSLGGVQSYRKAKASWKPDLCRANPW